MVVEQCLYNTSNIWSITFKPSQSGGGADFTLTVKWGGTNVYAASTGKAPSTMTTFTKNGYTYTRGTMVSSSTQFYVCRK